MPDERLTTRAYAAVEKEPLYGFTLAHLLTIICRKQHDAWYRMARHEPGKPQESLRYEWLWIVSIARSDGMAGPVRWYPEIEVRVPREHWDVPATPQVKALSPPSTPHREYDALPLRVLCRRLRSSLQAVPVSFHRLSLCVPQAAQGTLRIRFRTRPSHSALTLIGCTREAPRRPSLPRGQT